MMPRVLVIALALLTVAWLDPFRDRVSEGNRKFRDKKYEDAKERYRDAARYAPNERARTTLGFNRGAADYMLERHEDAAAAFSQALQAEDRDVQKRAFFNLGNTYLKEKKYREAIDAYVSALRIDPTYEAPKKNLEYLLKKNQQQNKDDQKNGKDGSDGKNDRKDTNDRKKPQDKKDAKDKDGDDRQQRPQGAMSREQVKNILESMKNKPVRRSKGKGDGIRTLEKPW